MKGELIKNWSNYPKLKANVRSFKFQEEAKFMVNTNDEQSIITRGNGRCYGDASLHTDIISSLDFSNILQFDAQNGIIECESGILLNDILNFIVPKGWFLPVTPGTKYITLGGALASDVHGKNHHSEGSFSKYVISFSLLKSNGEIEEVNKSNNNELFELTAGGMGLSGCILSVKFQLKKVESSYIVQQQKRAGSLDEVLELFNSHHHYTYTMAWIDCLSGGKSVGRSVMFAGEHATLNDLPSSFRREPLKVFHDKFRKIPFNFPSFVLNRLSVRAFNQLYYTTHSNKSDQIINYNTFFYPLDAILEWNRMYGKKGFLQYQFLLPETADNKALKTILAKIRQKGWGSFLAVLKRFGVQKSLISFPDEGLTLALDFPFREGLLEFLDELDKIVMDNGGRVYLSKDARMKSDVFAKTYPNYNQFKDLLLKHNPNGKFNSHLAERLNLLNK